MATVRCSGVLALICACAVAQVSESEFVREGNRREVRVRMIEEGWKGGRNRE